MCYHVSTPSLKDMEAFLDTLAPFTIEDYEPYYHISGFNHPRLPVITGDDPHKVQPVIWGYIPPFAKNLKDAQQYMVKTLNSKTETAWETPMYRSATPVRRCIVLVQGFFEWRWDDEKGKTKVPHFIYMPDKKPFALGGLWGDWTDKDTGELFRTCSIYTTEANELMATIHNSKKRMPLIIPEDSWSPFIGKETPADAVKSIMRPFPDGNLQFHEISKLITARGADTNVPEVQEAYNVPPTTLF